MGSVDHIINQGSNVPCTQQVRVPVALPALVERTGSLAYDTALVTSLVPEVGVHSQRNLFWSPRKLRRLLCFARSRTHGFLEIAINRVIELAFPLAQRKRVEVQSLVLSGAEIFSFPLLQRAIRLEI